MARELLTRLVTLIRGSIRTCNAGGAERHLPKLWRGRLSGQCAATHARRPDQPARRSVHRVVARAGAHGVCVAVTGASHSVTDAHTRYLFDCLIGLLLHSFTSYSTHRHADTRTDSLCICVLHQASRDSVARSLRVTPDRTCVSPRRGIRSAIAINASCTAKLAVAPAWLAQPHSQPPFGACWYQAAQVGGRNG